MPLPPWDQVWDLLRLLLAPALAASLIVMLALRVLGGERLAPLAAALAVAAAVFAGNHFMPLFQWELQPGRPLTLADFRTALGWSLETKPSATSSDPTGPGSRAWRCWWS
jgi:hypothetical protein